MSYDYKNYVDASVELQYFCPGKPKKYAGFLLKTNKEN